MLSNKKIICPNNLISVAKKTCEKLQCKILDKSEVIVYDEYIGPGYGEPSDAMKEAIKLLAEKEAILLDPVYSGKGFAGLIGLIKNSNSRCCGKNCSRLGKLSYWTWRTSFKSHKIYSRQRRS